MPGACVRQQLLHQPLKLLAEGHNATDRMYVGVFVDIFLKRGATEPEREEKGVAGLTTISIFDEHNKAFSAWHGALHHGILQEPLDLFHVDAHDDMGRPAAFSRSLYCDAPPATKEYLNYYAGFAEVELGIGDFILPAVLCGLIRNVYFVTPAWRNVKRLRKTCNVASVFGEGRLLKYDLVATSPRGEKMVSAYPDRKVFRYVACEAARIPTGRRVILDIDFDYFACRDSVANEHAYELEITPEQFLRKEVFLSDRRLPYSGLEFTFSQRHGRYYATAGFKKIRDASHLPTHEELANDMDDLISTLEKKGVRPALVTVSRSCRSGYCPADYSRAIETPLLRSLDNWLKDGITILYP